MSKILLISLLFLGIASVFSNERCRLPKQIGPCRGLIPRVWFNRNTGQCENFFYGGCQGNENNFETVQECERSCLMVVLGEADNVCSLPPVTGMCRAYIPSWFFNPSNGECETFVYGGCGGNGNRFSTQQACQERCSSNGQSNDICDLKAEVGPCRAAFQRFAWNKNTQKCEQFIYGGCQGNANNFADEQSCLNRCQQ